MPPLLHLPLLGRRQQAAVLHAPTLAQRLASEPNPSYACRTAPSDNQTQPANHHLRPMGQLCIGGPGEEEGEAGLHFQAALCLSISSSLPFFHSVNDDCPNAK